MKFQIYFLLIIFYLVNSFTLPPEALISECDTNSENEDHTAQSCKSELTETEKKGFECCAVKYNQEVGMDDKNKISYCMTVRKDAQFINWYIDHSLGDFYKPSVVCDNGNYLSIFIGTLLIMALIF